MIYNFIRTHIFKLKITIIVKKGIITDLFKNIGSLDQDKRKEYDSNEDVRNLFEGAMKIEGSVRNIQTHAAGVIISKDPLDNSVPIQRPPVSDDDAPPLTQYEMFALADLGLLKMDFFLLFIHI
mgnify:CR=1 FL=1